MTALYTYREAARERGVTKPNVVMPVTAHVALDKGAYWMDVEVRHAPLTDKYTGDVAAMGELIDDQTIALVGSAGDYGHGLIDPIADIAALAQEHGIGMHVDYYNRDRHAEYLVHSGDLHGFTHREIVLLGALILGLGLLVAPSTAGAAPPAVRA